MAEVIQMNVSWLDDLTNPHHDGTTQQIDDFVQAFVTDNARFLEKAAAVHQARVKEDEVWLKAQRDPAVKRLEAARRATDQAITDLYKTITAMMELVPSAELTTLATQLKGLELYAKQYYIASASSGSNNASGGGDNGGSTDGDEPTPTPGPTPEPTPDPSGGGDGGDGGDDEPDQ